METRPEDRPGLLETLCGGDASLLAEVQELLAYHDEFEDGAGGDGGGIELSGEIGPYRIERLLGRGGMGRVYLASRAGGLERPVALKVLPRTKGARRSRFQKEIEALGRLHHPGIARLVDSGELPTEWGPLPYLATEFIEGRSLRHVIEAGGPETPERVLSFMAEVVETLGFAHQRGVVHRDLKPENVMIDGAGRARLLDFGVARLENPSVTLATRGTQVGQIIGTLQYMAPEQASAGGGVIDGRADIYALGVIAYEWLAGRPPYSADSDSIHSAMVQIFMAVPTPLGQLNPVLAGPVERIVARCLAKKADNRYDSAAELVEDLRRYRAGESLIPWKPVSDELLIAGNGAHGSPAPHLLRGLAFVAVLLLAIVAIVRLDSGRNAPSTPSAGAPAVDPYAPLLDALAIGDRKLHRSGGTEEAIRDGIAVFEAQRPILAALPPRPFKPRLEMYLHWRLGEGHVFLAHMHHDLAELESAGSEWELADEAANRATTLDGLDSTAAVFPEVARLGRHHPKSGVAGVRAELADYRLRLVNLMVSCTEQCRALDKYNDPRIPNYDPHHPPAAADRAVDRAMLLSDLADISAELGFVQMDTTTMNTALLTLARSDSAWTFKGYRSPYGSFLNHYGHVYRLRAELIGRHADLDSAQAWLTRALALRTAADSPDEYAATKTELARVALLRARLIRGGPERRRALNEGLDALAAARSALGPEGRAFTLAGMDAVEAELLTELGLLGDAAALDRADALVRGAEKVITRQQYPGQHARLAVTLGRVAEARYRRLGDIESVRSARVEVRNALEETPPDVDPRLHGLLNDLAKRLSVPGGIG